MTSRPWLSAPRKYCECQVGPIGVTPIPNALVCSTDTFLPFSVMVPSTFDWNGSVCAMWFA